MGEILFIGHRIPFPPDRGDKIRSHHVLKALADFASVHVATFADDDADLDHESELAELAASYCLVRRSKWLPVAGIQALLRVKPVSVTAFHHAALAHYVSKVLATRPIAAIYIFSGQMAHYVPPHFAGRVVTDFVDVDSVKFESYARSSEVPTRLIHTREARLLRAEEARVAARSHVSLLISEEEAALFRDRLPEPQRAHCDVRVLGNGVDTATFDPSAVEAEPRMLDCPGPRLIFTGQMDYAPNVEAVVRVAERILPRLREAIPAASFHIVGRNPAGRVKDLHGRNGVHVWGRVDDMRPWLKAADAALVPLDIARGVQNKVLEAMAMELPVVLTPGAATGIAADTGTHLSVAEGDAALFDQSVSLLSDGAKARAMGKAARECVIARASWKAALAGLPDLLGMTNDEARHAA